MNRWVEEKNYGDKIGTGVRDTNNPKMAVSKAKVITSEYSVQNLSGFDEEVYLKIRELIEYCNIK